MSVDKFPIMANYMVPAGVRLADTARIRLGAYIGEGTVMHEGFVVEMPLWVQPFQARRWGINRRRQRSRRRLRFHGRTIRRWNRNHLSVKLPDRGDEHRFPLADGWLLKRVCHLWAWSTYWMLQACWLAVKAAQPARNAICCFDDSLSGAVEALPQQTQISLNQDLHSNNHP